MFYGCSSLNQALSFDTSKVTVMTNMFYVRSTPTQNLMPGLNLHLPDALPAPNFTPLHKTCTQATPVSAANKLIIRCAWAGTPVFASAGYGSNWAPGSCTSG